MKLGNMYSKIYLKYVYADILRFIMLNLNKGKKIEHQSLILSIVVQIARYFYYMYAMCDINVSMYLLDK